MENRVSKNKNEKGQNGICYYEGFCGEVVRSSSTLELVDDVDVATGELDAVEFAPCEPAAALAAEVF